MTLILESYLKRTNSFIKFLLVGVINTLVGLSMIFVLLHFLRLNYWISTFIGNSVGAAVSYMLNKNFTFNNKRSVKKSVPLFVVVIVICYFFSYGISKFISHLLVHPVFILSEHTIAVLLGTGIYTISNYLGQKYIVFKKS